MRMSFEEISHTADVKIRVHAPTLEALFSETFKALMQVMYGTDRAGSIRKTITLQSSDNESLLAELSGEPFDPVRHSGGSEVKGISYSGLAITHEANGYMLDIIFDV
jgi:SHS2 domain-containing protein